MFRALLTSILIVSLMFSSSGCGAPVTEQDDVHWIDDQEASALGLGTEFAAISAALEAIAVIVGGAALAAQLAIVAIIFFVPSYLYINSSLFDENLTTVKQLWYMVGAYREAPDVVNGEFIGWYKASIQALRDDVQGLQADVANFSVLASAFAQLVTHPELTARLDESLDMLAQYELTGFAAELVQSVAYYREYSLIAQEHFPDLSLDAAFAEEWFRGYGLNATVADLHGQNRELGLPPGYNGQHDGTGTDHLTGEHMENIWVKTRVKELKQHFEGSIPDIWIGVAKCADFSLAQFSGQRGPYGVGYGFSKQSAMFRAIQRLTDPLGPNAMRIENHGLNEVVNTCRAIPLFGQSLKGYTCEGSGCL